MSKANILIVEDDPLQRKLIKENLEQEDYAVFESASGKEALNMIGDHPIDIAIVDYKLDGETGISVIHDILVKNPLTTPIMVTAFGNIENAVEAIKKGAYDYIVKPIDFGKFLLVIARALERLKLKKMSNIYLNLSSLEKRKGWVLAST